MMTRKPNFHEHARQWLLVTQGEARPHEVPKLAAVLEDTYNLGWTARKTAEFDPANADLEAQCPTCGHIPLKKE